MASQHQAARLATRMQRELRMLSSDPPPRACAWPVDDHILTHLHAQIQGPEGTVYAGGIFKLDIEVPERLPIKYIPAVWRPIISTWFLHYEMNDSNRSHIPFLEQYPFEPPCITFVTPVYHPNVDTGGRICLDILNLPPKGAWRPSLNISTLLASIGLLLAEPNPDDGLMVDITAEYKHDRTKFDAKARKWTQLYAIHDGSKPKGMRDDIQEAASYQGEIPLEPSTFLGRMQDDVEAVVTEAQLKRVPEDDTVCPRKKLSLQKDLKDPILSVSAKSNHLLHKRKTPLQSGSKDLISSASYISNHIVAEKEFHTRERITSMEKENKPPENSCRTESLVASVNCFLEERTPNPGTQAPSKFKSLKLRPRPDIYASKFCSASNVSDSGIGSGVHSVETHPMETSNCDVKNCCEVPTVIVSDSESDEELSESLSFSLSQRHLNHKRKVRSKVG